MTPRTECTCPDLNTLIAGAMADQDTPPCPAHRPETTTSPPVALNDDAALARIIGAALISD